MNEPIFELTRWRHVELLTDAESWDLSISWPEVLSGWKDAESLLTCLESIDGCSLKDSLLGRWSAGPERMLGVRFCRTRERCKTVRRLEELLDIQRQRFYQCRS